MTVSQIASGFKDTGVESQAVFRAAMMAMARPGMIHKAGSGLVPPPPLHPASAALALALCDFETPLWLDADLEAESSVKDFLRFHTGAPLVSHHGKADFAFVSDASAMPDLESFALGSLEYPDRSTTIIIQVETLDNKGGWKLAGPGINGQMMLNAAPLPPLFLQQASAARALFPRGADFYFVSGDALAALPRSTLIEA